MGLADVTLTQQLLIWDWQAVAMGTRIPGPCHSYITEGPIEALLCCCRGGAYTHGSETGRSFANCNIDGTDGWHWQW